MHALHSPAPPAARAERIGGGQLQFGGRCTPKCPREKRGHLRKLSHGFYVGIKKSLRHGWKCLRGRKKGLDPLIFVSTF